ncbi:MAG: hypothetical protein RLY21_2518 [Planctomycetota bacterium]|jgi:hypothetical protein
MTDEPATDEPTTIEPAAIDPALAGRELGPWFMVPWWISVPVAVLLAGLLVWYFIRLGRGDVPRGRRWLRRASVVLALVGLAPLVRALTFAHPHEDRVAFAVAWSSVLFVLIACLVLALVDVILVTRSGVREFRTLRRQTLGGKAAAQEETGNG